MDTERIMKEMAKEMSEQWERMWEIYERDERARIALLFTVECIKAAKSQASAAVQIVRRAMTGRRGSRA